MSILKSLGLKGLGRESFDNPLDETAEGYIATGDESETASAAILEATVESAEIDEELEVMDDTTEAIEDLDDQAEIAEVAVEHNAYTPQLAMIQRVAMKNTLTKIAPRREVVALVDSKLMPAQESFEDGNGGVLAAESFRETAGELWTSAKKQFKEIMGRIVKFLMGIFDAATKLENRAEKLKSVTKNAKAGKVKVSGAKTLMVGNKLGSDAIDGLSIFLEALNRATDEGEVASNLAALTSDAKDGTAISFTGGTVPSDVKSTAGSDADVTCSKEACGGYVFVTIKGKGENAIKGTRNIVHQTGDKKAPEESDALSSSEAGNAVNLVLQIAKAAQRGKAVAKKFDSFVKQYDANISKASKDEDKTKQAAARKKMMEGLTYARNITAFRKDVVAKSLAAGNAMCNYVEVSCGKPGKGDKEGSKNLPA